MSRAKTKHPKGYGKTGTRTHTGHCSECGYANFDYNNGSEYSENDVRGYRCVKCKTIKPELP